MKKIRIALIIICVFSATILAIQIAANASVARRLQKTAGETHVTWGKLNYHLLSGRVVMKNVCFTKGENRLRAEKIIIHSPLSDPLFPGKLTMEASGLLIPLESADKTQLLSEMGISQVEGRVYMSILSDADNLEVSIHSASFDGLGELSGVFSFAPVAGGPLQIFSAIPEEKIRKLDLLFTDDGFVDKVVLLFAVQSGTPVMRSKSRILEGINRRIQTVLRDDDESLERISQIYRFFDDPRSISVVIKEGSDLRMGDFLPQGPGWRETALWLSGLPVELKYIE